MEVLASHDPKDSTSMERRDCDFTSALSEDVRGMRIGIPESYFGQGLDQEVKDAVLEAARVLGKGAIVETTDLKLAGMPYLPIMSLLLRRPAPTCPGLTVVKSTATGRRNTRGFTACTKRAGPLDSDRR